MANGNRRAQRAQAQRAQAQRAEAQRVAAQLLAQPPAQPQPPAPVINRPADLVGLDVPINKDWSMHILSDIAEQKKHERTCWAHSIAASIEEPVNSEKGEGFKVKIDAHDLIKNVEISGKDLANMNKPYKWIEDNNITGRLDERRTTRVSIHNHVVVEETLTDGQLLSLVAQGPVCANIRTNDTFNDLDGDAIYTGVLDNRTADHCIVIVGYGTTQTGDSYWKIRNSWGKQWGLMGYARIRRLISGGVKMFKTIHYPLFAD